MNFYNFMMRKHLNEDTPKGDLAYDMRRDKENFPRNRPCKFDGWHKIIQGYLLRMGACTGCLETFEECWKEYVVCEKSKRKKN